MQIAICSLYLQRTVRFTSYNTGNWEGENERMVTVKSSKVAQILMSIHDGVLHKERRDGNYNFAKDEVVAENRVLMTLCLNKDARDEQLTDAVNSTYKCRMSVDDVVNVLSSSKIASRVWREKVLDWASELADLFEDAVMGNKESFEEFEKKRKEPLMRSGEMFKVQERLAILMIYAKHPEIDIHDDLERMMNFSNTFMKYCLYDISDAIRLAYKFPKYRRGKLVSSRESGTRTDGTLGTLGTLGVFDGLEVSNDRNSDKVVENKGLTEGKQHAENKLTYEQAIQRVDQLECMLERTSNMLQDLQEDFEVQLEENKVKELTDFFAKLNSEKYGCILDELLVVRKGVDELRKKKYELPIEINGMLIMIKKLIQFVRDNHIEPVMRVNDVKDVAASDVEFCDYDGTPFTSPSEHKRVKVVSPGWVYKDRDIQISRPKVKEQDKEE